MSEAGDNKEYAELKKRFDKYYEERLLPILRSNEKERRRYLRYFGMLLFMAIFFYPLIVYVLLTLPLDDSGDNVGLVAGVSTLVVGVLCGPICAYKRKVKPQLMPVFAEFFGTFTYEYEAKISDDVLRASGVFGSYNHSQGDDFFAGVYDGVHISIAEEKLQMKKRDFRGHNMTRTVFKGICILFEMNKNFKGRTVVLKDSGMFNMFNRVSGLQNVKLEDLRFEKVFEVYSDDQIEARYLLTSAFMERMLKLRDLYEGKSIQFSFKDNKLLLAVPTSQDMFEANSFFGSNVNKAKIDIVFEQFYTIFSIVRILKLNQRTGL